MAKRNRNQPPPNPADKLKQLEQAVGDNPPPLVAAIAIDRLTGRWIPAIGLDQKNVESDIQLLLQVLRQLDGNLQNDLVRLAEERGARNAIAAKNTRDAKSAKPAENAPETE